MVKTFCVIDVHVHVKIRSYKNWHSQKYKIDTSIAFSKCILKKGNQHWYVIIYLP